MNEVLKELEDIKIQMVQQQELWNIQQTHFIELLNENQKIIALLKELLHQVLKPQQQKVITQPTQQRRSAL